ncbi:endonuclease/exonuclease/phosphatase family protein [Candidatus Woesebacteria bacterium]|nr:endonuclease/exonuclease/phosphatase family protein [Candidatus Woesebacteria bacterium]
MPLSVLTLNIEGDRHLETFIPEVATRNVDIVCLQEVFEADLPEIAIRLGFFPSQYAFLGMSLMNTENQYHISPRGPWGIAMFTSLAHADFQNIYYKGEGMLPEFTTPNSVDRGLLYTTVYGDDDQELPIATTHFTWTGDGQPSPEQERDFASLAEKVATLPPHVLCGDFNAPRGRETFRKFETLYTDPLPAEVTTTLDKNLHYTGKDLQLVVDTAFYQEPLQVEVVEVIEGISDHKGINFLVHS